MERADVVAVVVALAGLGVVQLGLVSLRNRLRRWIHRPRSATEATATAPTPELEQVIREELEAVFDDDFEQHRRVLDDDSFRRLVNDLAAATAERVGRRLALDPSSRGVVARELPREVLRAIGPPARRPDPYSP